MLENFVIVRTLIPFTGLKLFVEVGSRNFVLKLGISSRYRNWSYKKFEAQYLCKEDLPNNGLELFPSLLPGPTKALGKTREFC